MDPDFITAIEPLFRSSPWALSGTALILLLLLAWTTYRAGRHVFTRLLQRLVTGLRDAVPGDVATLPMPGRLATLAAAVAIMLGIGLVPGLPAALVTVAGNVCSAIVLGALALLVGDLLDYAGVLHQRRPGQGQRPIKGFLQVAKLLVYIVGALLALSVLIDRDPLILLSGLGAMAAVLLLVFQDTLLSLVASVQIGSSGIVRVGDWIEVPQVGADGEVVDIALHTVTVRNWDHTLTVFPTRKLVSESFRNWRGMSESGGRRIKRALFLDQTSVRFLDTGDVQHLRRFGLLETYLEHKERELAGVNHTLAARGADPLNARRLTNLGTFRAYVDRYLAQHPRIHRGMTRLVRQQQPGACGIPLEIYCFADTTAWNAYEDIQSDIFDHLLAILDEFGLRVFQQPAGTDLRGVLTTATRHPPRGSALHGTA